MPKKLNYPAYVGFGMLTPVTIMVIDKLPRHNTGALVKEFNEFVFDDAAIVACLLRQWGLSTGMIGTAVGDDPRGHALANQLKKWGVQGKVRFAKHIKTPIEVNVSDRTGARTYFWNRPQNMLDSLDTADLSMIKHSQMVYADWYDGDHIVRAMDEANRHHVPVFLNFEHAHKNPELFKKYAGRATVCQAVTDAAQIGKRRAMLSVARKLLKAGIKTALITMAGEGCLAVQGDDIVRVYAPKVKVVDGCGAGATFSAGYIYGYLMDWNLEDSVRFATAAASLKVTRAGLRMFPVQEIMALASELRVQHMEFRDDRFHNITDLFTIPFQDVEQAGKNIARLMPKNLFPKRNKSKIAGQARVKRRTI